MSPGVAKKIQIRIVDDAGHVDKIEFTGRLRFKVQTHFNVGKIEGASGRTTLTYIEGGFSFDMSVDGNDAKLYSQYLKDLEEVNET